MAPLLKRVAALYSRFAAQDAQSDLRGAEINTFGQDVSSGIRVLRKDPGFAAAAILTLAVGIGANTAIFSVVNSVLLRPLAFADSSRLVRLYTHDQTRENLGLTFLDFIDVRERAHAFRGLAASWENDANLFDQNGPQKIRAAFATADLFPLLGVQPHLGRLFRPSDDRVGYEPSAVISYGLWQRRYGGDPSIVGRSIEVDSFAVHRRRRTAARVPLSRRNGFVDAHGSRREIPHQLALRTTKPCHGCCRPSPARSQARSGQRRDERSNGPTRAGASHHRRRLARTAGAA